MSPKQLSARREEFFSNVWDHAQDPFQTQFDDRRFLNREERRFLERVSSLVRSIEDDQQLGTRIFAEIDKSSDRLHLLLQLCGLTRNKIITDLKPSASSKKMGRFPSTLPALLNNEEGLRIAGPYIAAWTRRVFGVFPDMLEALNQATWPGYIRQERAKRMGHEGEHRLAIVLDGCGIPFEPHEKVDNPLCGDAMIDGVSFDIVVPEADSPSVCVKATVHTSNIGQYGESKDSLEISEAKRMLDEKFTDRTRPCLLALIDGIGFKSNRAGLDGVLSDADEFCQFHTLWKAAVIAARLTDTAIMVELPRSSIRQHKRFIERFDFQRHIVEKAVARPEQRKLRRVPAGEAILLVSLE